MDPRYTPMEDDKTSYDDKGEVEGKTHIKGGRIPAKGRQSPSIASLTKEAL